MAHWYDNKGNKCYTVVGANGDIRDTTLKDARKCGFVPSSTGIINQLSKIFVEKWKLDHHLKVCWEYHNKNIFLDCDHYKEAIKTLTNPLLIKSRDLGVEVHDSFEKFYKTSKCKKHLNICKMIINKINEKIGRYQYISEESFYCNFGYGGTVDLYCKNPPIVIDLKVKNNIKKCNISFDYAMQLGSYRFGLEIFEARCFNVFIIIDDECQFKDIIINECDNSELIKAFDAFKCLLKYWQISNKMKPEIDYLI